eukprot:206438_1
MGSCTSTQSEKHNKRDEVIWLQNFSNGTPPPKYIRVIVRYHRNDSHISGYYRNISIDHPDFNSYKNSSIYFPVYMRVLDINGFEIKPYHVQYLYSREIVSGSSWVITEYNSLRKHPHHGYIVSSRSYHNTKHYFTNTTDDEPFTTQIVNLERHSYNRNHDHTNIYKLFSNDLKECDTCTVSMIPLDAAPVKSNISEEYIDTVFTDMFNHQLLYFDVDVWANRGINDIESFKRDRERVFDWFFGPKCMNQHIQYNRKFKKQNIDKSRLKLYGIDDTSVTQYDEVMDLVYIALTTLNPNPLIKDIIASKTRYDRIIEDYVQTIEPLVCRDKEQKEVLNMVFPLLYREEPWNKKNITK